MRLAAAVFILCTGAALLPFAPAASAIGKGGWDHVGLGGPTGCHRSMDGCVPWRGPARNAARRRRIYFGRRQHGRGPDRLLERDVLERARRFAGC